MEREGGERRWREKVEKVGGGGGVGGGGQWMLKLLFVEHRTS